MWFAFDLIDEGRISAEGFVGALRQQLRCRRPLGQLAVEAEMMTMPQVFEVLSRQSDRNEPFGELAIEMGFLSREDLSELIVRQMEAVPLLEELLVECGAITKRDLEDSLARLRSQVGTFRERQFESIPEGLSSGV